MNALAPIPALLKTKQHFEILDGLRGVAAVAVVIFHFMEFVTPDYHDNFIAHSYLAVDFFFCLSGFVITYAYDNKVEKTGVIQFIKLRLIRLHPLVVIGALIGLLTFVFDPFSKLQEAYNAGQTLLMFLSSCLLIPYPVVHERYFNLFHFNPPTWSLFWEYIANILYASLLFKLKNSILWILTLIAAAALSYESYRSGYLGVGWGGDNFIGGGSRIFYSFLAGMLVYRSNWIIRTRLGFVPIAVLLILAFLVPYAEQTNTIADPLLVIFYFPFLIALAAGAQLRATFVKICRFLGDISYPLYMIHYPFLWMYLSYVEVIKPPMSLMALQIPIGVLLLIGLAYIIMLYLDIPVRKYLKGRQGREYPQKKSVTQ